MTFFARPILEDDVFIQPSGAMLTLSGITDFTGILKSKGVEIDATTGITGTVLTYIGGKIQLHPTGAGNTPVFNTNRLTTRSGIPTVNAGTGCTVQCFLENYFFPSIPPSASLAIFGTGTRQFGDCGVGNLAWSVTRNTYPICGISGSTNGTGLYNCVILSNGCVGTTGGTVPYTYSFSCATPTTACTSTNVGFKLCAVSCINEPTTASTTINWSNKNFSFVSSTLYTNSLINTVLSATTGVLSTTKTLSTAKTLSNQFYYYAYPKIYGTPTFTVNGLPNNAWGNSNIGTLFTTTFINTNGYSNQYYVARSDNRLTGTFNISIL